MGEDHPPLSVSALTRQVQDALAGFGPVSVQGELSQVKLAASGHFYATLKDAGAVLSLVMWRSAVQRMGRLPAEGSQVVARGAIEVYPPRGQYQLVATRIAAVGQGDLHARFLQLKARLEAEGLFDPDTKRPLPVLPRAVGLATAAGSAALADMLHSIRARFPRMPVVVAPCLVQGPQAAPSIVAALARLGRHPEVEVIVCGRGGGSLEDLWAFNEEAVVRAIAACPVPVVSAVGHETDTTLADLAADLRAKTPTAAGETVVPVWDELVERLQADREQLDAGIDGLLEDLRERWSALRDHRALAGPGHQLGLRRQRLDELDERLRGAADAAVAAVRTRQAGLAARLRPPAAALAAAQARREAALRALAAAGRRRVEAAQARLAAAAGRLDALSPLGVLARGYSVVRTGDRRLVRLNADAPPGTAIEARTGDGWLLATVDGHRRQRLNEPESGYDAGVAAP